MAQFKEISAIIIIFGIFTICYVASATSSKICNGIKYDAVAYIASSITYVQQDVTYHTSSNGYDYYSQSPGDTNVAYGHGVCYEGQSADNCDSCMIEALGEILYGCPLNTGAQVEIDNCRLRYEIYPFTE